MTDAEKISMMRGLIAPDTDTDEVLDAMIRVAEGHVLNRMYPFGYTAGTTVPSQYESLQVELAVELYNRRGAEGQLSHSENGISRSWSEKSKLLSRIVPHCGSVIAE